jgi:hypothetical protein
MANQDGDKGRKQGEGGGQAQGRNNDPGQKSSKPTGDDQDRSSGKSAADRGDARGSEQGQNVQKDNVDNGRGDGDR